MLPNPNPLLLKTIIDVQQPIDDFLKRNIGSIMSKAVHVKVSEANKTIRETKTLKLSKKK